MIIYVQCIIKISIDTSSFAKIYQDHDKTPIELYMHEIYIEINWVKTIKVDVL